MTAAQRHEAIETLAIVQAGMGRLAAALLDDFGIPPANIIWWRMQINRAITLLGEGDEPSSATRPGPAAPRAG